MTAGWYPDPSGRFSRRYFDGGSWTDQVVGANGMATVDRLEAATALAAPADPAAGAATRPTARTLSWIGLAIAALGTGLATLSVTALSWAGDTTFGDLRKVSDTFESSSNDDALLAYHYGAWAWPLLLVLVVAGLVLVASVVNRRDGTLLRVVVAGVAALGAITHAGYVTELFDGPGPSPEAGAWAGAIGYLVAIIGLAIATPRRRSRA